MTSLLVPPPTVRGKNELDKEAFSITLDKVPSLALPTKSLNNYRGKLKDFLLKLPKFKSVQPSQEIKECSVIYLDPRTVDKITDTLKNDVEWSKNFKESQVILTYENWPCDEVLRAVLPENVEVPTSYSLIGHIVHLNLREEQLPYKSIIGQVFLDKIPTARTVINKLDAIDNTYRNFAMEVLVGENNTIVSVKESGIIYRFDFAKVYWNPRLCTEHAALVKLLEPGDVLYDIFAGVGPFAIPAAKKGVKVIANDLNPESCRWLFENARANKVMDRTNVFNKDGREFIRVDVKNDILERREKKAEGKEHMTMNLPAIAVEFLDVFADWLSNDEVKKVCTQALTIHVYCFVKAAKTDDFRALARLLVEDNLGVKLNDDDSLTKIHHVRNVAPNKEMMRVSFELTRDLLRMIMAKRRTSEEEEPAGKRAKLEQHDKDLTDNVSESRNNGQEQG